jgi:uncharacterized protein YigE (DUF2233 family)
MHVSTARAVRRIGTAQLSRVGVCVVATLVLGAARDATLPSLPSSSLSIRSADGWRAWWESRNAPTRWTAANPLVTGAVLWQPVRPGVEVGEMPLAGNGEAWRLRIILVRLTPAALRLSLAQQTRDLGTRGAWTIDSVPATSVLAVNAGQFMGGRPWGWLVLNGREVQPPGTGALGMAFLVDSSGAARLVPAAAIAGVRASGRAMLAFQSYPTLLTGDGEVPEQLQHPDAGVDVAHRDSRLAIGELRDGRVLIALTRFDALDGTLSLLPFGPTIPEMAALMGALGCRQALALDGGISGQLAVRGSDGSSLSWPGMRRVPLALLASPR